MGQSSKLILPLAIAGFILQVAYARKRGESVPNRYCEATSPDGTWIATDDPSQPIDDENSHGFAILFTPHGSNVPMLHTRIESLQDQINAARITANENLAEDAPDYQVKEHEKRKKAAKQLLKKLEVDLSAAEIDLENASKSARFTMKLDDIKTYVSLEPVEELAVEKPIAKKAPVKQEEPKLEDKPDPAAEIEDKPVALPGTETEVKETEIIPLLELVDNKFFHFAVVGDESPIAAKFLPFYTTEEDEASEGGVFALIRVEDKFELRWNLSPHALTANAFDPSDSVTQAEADELNTLAIEDLFKLAMEKYPEAFVFLNAPAKPE